ncbi:hypothetical protein H5V44_17080 [Halobellus sp. MBLA0160]|uniref:Uncharacterized protein n=2 Tax=Halobellus ruber TaxID=2761102 RepID=A0A7J9SN89_9EURY|nr:hypothetical protein [Halobellus ruber]
MSTNRTLPPHEVVGILADRDPDVTPVATSSYVAEQAGVSKPTALSRLRDVEEDGRVRHAELGQATVWWLEEDPITAKRAREMFGGKGPHEDTLDVIDASDELRERVEGVRAEDEDLEATVRRLVREGAQASTPAAKKERKAKWWAETSLLAFLLFAAILAVAGQGLSSPLPIPLVSVTGEDVLAGGLLVIFATYIVNRADAAIAARGERGGGEEDE